MLVLGLAAAEAHAQEPAAVDSASVTGVVVAADGGDPLAATLVRVVGLNRQDLTHTDGAFHLLNLPAGRHTILFERIGFRTDRRSVELLPGQELTIRVELEVSVIEIPALVVTGTIGPSLSDRTVRPINALQGTDLQRKLDLTVAGTLHNEPGLATASMGPATARPVIRALGGDRVLVLEDGARIGDLSSASPDHALSVDPLNAQRIEVVRGPAALIYGSNAIGGVINVIREEVPSALPDRLHGTLTLQGQSVNRGVATGATVLGRLRQVAVRGEGSARTAGDLRTPRGPLRNTELHTYNLSLGAALVRRAGHGGLAYRFYDSVYGIPGDEDLPGSHADGVEIEMRRHSLHGEAHARRDIGPFRTFDLDAKYSHYHHREMESETIVGTEFGLLTAGSELIARHETWGPLAGGALGVRLEWQDYRAGGSTQTTPARERAAAVFLLEEVAIGRFTLQGGGRMDWRQVEPLDTSTQVEIGRVRTRSFGAISGSLGGLYDLGGGVQLGAAIARAFRTPGISELFSQGPHLAAYIFEVGNPDLEAEFGLGLDAFVRVRRDDVQAEIAVFRNDLDNFIHYANTGDLGPGGLPIYQARSADARLEGLEGSLEWVVLPPLVLDGVVSHVRGTRTTDGQPLPLIPPLHGQLSLRYDRSRFFFRVGARMAAAQDRLGEFEQRTAGYTVFGASTGVRWTTQGRTHALTVRGENLTDRLYYEHLSRVKEIMPEAGTSLSATYRLAF